jgi:hypothetical protein
MSRILLLSSALTLVICTVIWPTWSLARVHSARVHHAAHHHFRSHSLLEPSFRCSVFGGPPCFPYQTCSSVFRRRPCVPDIVYPLGQDLQLTISSRASAELYSGQTNEKDRSKQLNTILDVFGDLRSCWIPPSTEIGRAGMQITVRVSFRRDGLPIGPPRVTYINDHDAPAGVQDAYRSAVDRMFVRCTPFNFTSGLGGAIAGRPFAIRFIDDRVF